MNSCTNPNKFEADKIVTVASKTIDIRAHNNLEMSGDSSFNISTTNSNDWSFGYSAFSNLKEGANNVATMYVLDGDRRMDITSFYADTNSLKMENNFNATDDQNFQSSLISIDQFGEIKLEHGYTRVNSISYDTASVITKVNENGLVLPSLDRKVKGENGAIYFDELFKAYRAYYGQWSNIVLVSDSIYYSDFDADKDPNLASGTAYLLNGDRTVYIKP